jgi:peptide/nickel transport system substrate-binding protein
LRLWNGRLTIRDEHENPRPQLAETVPELNTDTWKVQPDGRMETIYQLRPNLTYHDGRPVSAQDWVFSWRVYSSAEFGQSSPPIGLMQEVVAPDDGTILIRWKSPYVEAAELSNDFPPLPRHILDEPFRTSSIEAFEAHPFWGDGFVGTGPFRMTHWEPGAFVEGVAFDNYVFGRPKIDRVRLLFMPDPNTVVANLLSGEGDIAVDDSIRFEQGYTLRNQWSAGQVIFSPSQVRYTQPQLKPETAKPPALRDLRFRQALAHTIDKEALIEGLLQGIGSPADTLVVPQSEYYPMADRVVKRYPRDLRRAEQLLNEVGYQKGADGMFAHPTDGPIDLEVWAAQGTQNEAEITIMADTLKRAGIGARPYAIPAAAARDAVVNANAPGVTATSNINGYLLPLDRFTSDRIPTAQNRFTGGNRGGWSNSQFDRLAQEWAVALARPDRLRIGADLLRIISEDVSAYPLYFNFGVVAHDNKLQRILEGGANWSWNVHEWNWG